MNHDAAHKYLYALTPVVADLLRLVVPRWVDELDRAAIEDVSAEHESASFRRHLLPTELGRSFEMPRRPLTRQGRQGRNALGEDRAWSGSPTASDTD